MIPLNSAIETILAHSFIFSYGGLNLIIASITNIGAICIVIVMMHWVKRLRNSKATDLRQLVSSLALAKFAIWFWTFSNIVGIIFYDESIPYVTLPSRFMLMIVVLWQVRITMKIGPAPAPDLTLQKELDYDGRLILIVDDNEPFARFVRSALNRAGFNAEFATSGPDALTIVSLEAPSMLIVDIGLPGMDGVDFCLKARELGFNGPVVAISGAMKRIDHATLAAACFIEFASKPIGAIDLVNLVKRTLHHAKGA